MTDFFFLLLLFFCYVVVAACKTLPTSSTHMAPARSNHLVRYFVLFAGPGNLFSKSMIRYSTIDRYRSGDRDTAVLSPRTTSQVRQSEICEIPKPIKGFSLVRSKSESRFTRDNFFSHSQSNRILPGRLIHQYSDERRKAVRRSTSEKTLESCFGTHPSRMLPRPFWQRP